MARKHDERIKRPGTLSEYTPHQVHELKKCAQDPAYFFENYIRIQHPVKGSVPFKLYDYQKTMLNLYQNERYSIVLSARQTGKCASNHTKVGVVRLVPSRIFSINTIKKLILKLIDRKTYNDIYKRM